MPNPDTAVTNAKVVKGLCKKKKKAYISKDRKSKHLFPSFENPELKTGCQ